MLIIFIPILFRIASASEKVQLLFTVKQELCLQL